MNNERIEALRKVQSNTEYTLSTLLWGPLGERTPESDPFETLAEPDGYEYILVKRPTFSPTYIEHIGRDGRGNELPTLTAQDMQIQVIGFESAHALAIFLHDAGKLIPVLDSDELVGRGEVEDLIREAAKDDYGADLMTLQGEASWPTIPNPKFSPEWSLTPLRRL